MAARIISGGRFFITGSESFQPQYFLGPSYHGGSKVGRMEALFDLLHDPRHCRGYLLLNETLLDFCRLRSGL